MFFNIVCCDQIKMRLLGAHLRLSSFMSATLCFSWRIILPLATFFNFLAVVASKTNTSYVNFPIRLRKSH